MEQKKEGYKRKEYGRPVKRYVQTLDLKDDPELIARYRRAHSPEEVWPEIMAGIREVGILEMEIYLTGRRMTMIVETPDDFDWDEAMTRLATLPRQEEWEAFTAQFQDCAADATSAGKWQLMEQIFELEKPNP